MMKLKLMQFSALLLAGGLTLSSCSNSNARNEKINKEFANDVVEQEVASNDPGSMPVQGSKLKTELDNAKKAGKAVFVVVTANGVMEVANATTIANGAIAIYKNAIVVELNRDDASNASLVSEWRLSGATLPIILVVSPKGIPTGGYQLAQATSENLVALVPSPKLEEVYAAINSKKPAIVVFTKKTLSDRATVVKECQKTIVKLNNNAVLVEVDMDDHREVNFMNQLRIDKASKSSTTIVINTQGQVAGTSKTIPDATKLASAATQPVKSGCGPGCGPAGCGK